MEYRELGQSGLTVSEVSLGCWVTGGDYWGGADDDQSIAAIRKAVDCGINFIDTAELYGRGHSEDIVGRAIADLRQDVLLSSKVWKTNMSKDMVPVACEGSLKRLDADCIDVYFIHYPSDEIPIGETMEAMGKLKKEGKIRAIGLSNFTVAQIREAMQFGTVDVIQPCYSLLWRGIEEDVLPFCSEQGIGVVAYSPLAQGLLTGKFKPGATFPAGDGRVRTPLFQPGTLERCLEVAEGLLPYGRKYGKTQGQVAINWLTGREGVTSAIVGARTASQAEENAGAGGWRLSGEDAAAIDRIGRAVTDTLPHYVSFFMNKVKE